MCYIGQMCLARSARKNFLTMKAGGCQYAVVVVWSCVLDADSNMPIVAGGFDVMDFVEVVGTIVQHAASLLVP